MKINKLTLKDIHKAWRVLIVMQFALLLFFFVVSETFSESWHLVHITIYYATISAFILLLIVPLFACVKLGRNVLFAILVLIVFNVAGSIALYFSYKKDMLV